MIIILKKRQKQPSIITITRPDGSSTWNKIHRGLETHDIAHYAVEKTLNFKNAFYGLIAAGTNIQDFDTPRDRRPEEVIPVNLHVEAIQTEHIVNLLETELYQMTDPTSFLPMLKEILEEHQIPFPTILTESTLVKIRQTYHDLVHQWRSLKEGEQLKLLL